MGGFSWGGFAQGINQGLNTADRIGAQIDQAKVDKVRADAMEEARQAQASGISGMIKDNGISQPAQPKYESGAPKTGEAAPDTADVQTAVVPQPNTTITSAPLAPPVASPQAAADQGGPKPAPVAMAAPPTPMSDVPTGAVQAQPAPASIAAGGMTPDATPVRKRYSVGDASFDSMDEARAHAQKNAPSQEDLFIKNGVPKIREAYLAQGRPDLADAWSAYAERSTAKAAMKDWVKAFTTNDFDAQADQFGKFYTKHVDDGVDYTGHKLVTKTDGSQVAVVELKDKDSGKTSQVELTRDRMLQLAMSNNPQAMFEQAYGEKKAADAARAKNALAAAEDQRKLQNAVTLKGVDAGYKADSDKRLADREDVRADRKDIRDAAREDARAAREEANIRLKADLEAKFKKTTDPEERRAMIVTELSKNPLYANKSQADIAAAADKWMGAMQSGANPKPSSIKPDAKPPAGAAPAKGAAAPDVSGLSDGYYRDKETGEVFQMKGGQRLAAGKK